MAGVSGRLGQSMAPTGAMILVLQALVLHPRHAFDVDEELALSLALHTNLVRVQVEREAEGFRVNDPLLFAL